MSIHSFIHSFNPNPNPNPNKRTRNKNSVFILGVGANDTCPSSASQGGRREGSQIQHHSSWHVRIHQLHLYRSPTRRLLRASCFVPSSSTSPRTQLQALHLHLLHQTKSIERLFSRPQLTLLDGTRAPTKPKSYRAAGADQEAPALAATAGSKEFKNLTLLSFTKSYTPKKKNRKTISNLPIKISI